MASAGLNNMLWRYSCQRTSPGFLLVRSSPAFSPGDPEQGFRSGCACRLVGEREHGVGHPALEAVVVHEQLGVVAHYHGHHVSGDRQRPRWFPCCVPLASASPPSYVTTDAVRRHGRRRAERSGTTAAPSTCRSTTITASGACCTASRWPAISRPDCRGAESSRSPGAAQRPHGNRPEVGHSALRVQVDAGGGGIGIQAVGQRRAAAVHLQDGAVHEDAQGHGA